MDLWQGSWNNQVFTLSFHLVRAGKSYEKSDHFISQSMTQPAEVKCMVVVTARNYPTVAKAK